MDEWFAEFFVLALKEPFYVVYKINIKCERV